MVHKENHPMLSGDISSRSSPSVPPRQQGSDVSTSEKSQSSNAVNLSPESPGARLPPPPHRYVDGMLALCKSCGFRGLHFARCQRCKRVFTEEPKSVPIANKKVNLMKKEPEKRLLAKTTCGEGIKSNLLKHSIKTIDNNTPLQQAKRPRLRKPREKQPDPEPVILTLSSDQQDSNTSLPNKQQDKLSISIKKPLMTEIEGISDTGTGMEDDGSREEIASNSVSGIVTLNCRIIRIGSYRYTPKQKINISSKGVKIVAPNLKNESKDVAIHIQLREITKILVHFGKGLPVIFLYTFNKCGAYIRKMLDMTEETGPYYYNPISKNNPHRRITLLPDALPEEARAALKNLFGRQMDELNSQEATEILVGTCSAKENASQRA